MRLSDDGVLPGTFFFPLTIMASGFESERSLAARKEERRRQREALLKQAKADYEKEERSKELKRLRGEDKWMLPDVNERLEELGKEHSVSKKKKKEKHSKKHKKEKKHKVEKTADSSDSSDSSEEWVEASVSHSSSADKAWKLKKEPSNSVGSPAAVQRDEWMTLDFMSVKTSSSASLKAEKQREKVLEQQKAQANEQALLADRELNPYWKDGGTGLPPLEVTLSRKAAAVEDGGLSWLKKSYQRMKEQSEREKRDLDEIVAERYGSVEQFQSRLEAAEASTLRNDNDYKRYEQKRKYSEKECSMRRSEAKEKQEESSVGKYPYVGHPKKMDDGEWRHYKRERPREDKELGLKDVSYRTSNPIRRHEQPLSSSLKAAFLKPSDDRDQEPKMQSPSSQLLTPGFMSRGFRKPGGDDDNIPRWRKTQPKEETGKGAQDEKYFKPELSTANKEKEPREDPEESQDSTLERKEALNSSPSCLGSLSEDENPCILSDEEMNRLGARIVKAELMGNKDLAAKLQATLNSARKLKDSGTQSQSRELERKTTGFRDGHEVVLVRTDRSGGAWPVNVPGETLEPTGRRRKTTKVTTHVDKERIRYFRDDDNLTLKDLVRNEKMGTAEDQNKLFMRMASKFTDKTDREYYTLDDMFVSTAAKGECSGAEDARQRNQAIREHRQLAIQMGKCPHCFGSPEVPKHLIIAIGNKVYLSLPNYQSLTEGHCLIAPMQHYTAATLLDEDIWEEIQVFRKTLVMMFEAQGLDCVFLEINLSIKKRYHMVYECIPLPKEVGDMAPIYFKKAIMESDEEWSMNKKLIDLSSKDVRRAVPKGLPYFCVDFGLQGGFAHVIEDQHKFPVYFGKEIIGGMLDLEPRLWRKRLRENFEDQRKKVLHFAQKWKPYDFTKNKD